MKLKHFVLLCVFALLVSLVSLLLEKQQAGETEFEHQAFIRNFKLSELEQLSISRRDEKVVLARKEQQWVLPAHYDYGIDHEQLKSAMKKLQDAKIIELKTRDPRKLARLKLNDFNAIDQQGVLVELTQNEKTFAFLLGANATGNLGQYARLAGNNQSYLIDQRIDLPTLHKDWIDKSIFSVTEVDISELIWSKGDETFVIKRAQQGAEFELIEPNTEQILKYPSIFTGLVRNTINTEAEDIKPLTALDLKDLSLNFSIKLTLREQAKTQSIDFYQDKADNYWLKIEGRKWLFQISSFSFNQLGKDLTEYLNTTQK